MGVYCFGQRERGGASSGWTGTQARRESSSRTSFSPSTLVVVDVSPLISRSSLWWLNSPMASWFSSASTSTTATSMSCPLLSIRVDWCWSLDLKNKNHYFVVDLSKSTIKRIFFLPYWTLRYHVRLAVEVVKWMTKDRVTSSACRDLALCASTDMFIDTW